MTPSLSTSAMGKYKPRRVIKRQQTKRKTKDIDEVWEDSQPERAARIKNRPIDEDLPGLGKFYCIACARHFVGDAALQTHMKQQPHKKRVKKLTKEVPYGVDPADKYGMKIDNGKA
eukprot:TRINITY_DN2057_c0_g2_i1.p1 TRINITY_DN2057_c0_g2~~TRINITY_DN2057_c0_g2_i1.p1  ORF type:complete len:127 (-),score=24.24 TRINITY_DN2057_c0_g2_i1:211-558(-)